MYQKCLYDGQTSILPESAYIRYLFLPQDTSRLYCMHARIQGIDLNEKVEVNIHNWLNPKSPHFKPELHAAVFYYKERCQPLDRFKICIQTDEMKAASWKYAHGKQLILDGTFGLCDRRLLLFIGMAVDEKK